MSRSITTLLACIVGLACGIVIGAVSVAAADSPWWIDVCSTASREDGSCKSPPGVGYDSRGPMPTVTMEGGRTTLLCPSIRIDQTRVLSQKERLNIDRMSIIRADWSPRNVFDISGGVVRGTSSETHVIEVDQQGRVFCAPVSP